MQDTIFYSLVHTRIKLFVLLILPVNNKAITSVIGGRRTGKTTLLKQTIRQLIDLGVPKENIIELKRREKEIYFNKEGNSFNFLPNCKVPFLQSLKKALSFSHFRII